MKDKNQSAETQKQEKVDELQKQIDNPFTNHQSADQQIEQSKEMLESEQAFKEAQTERD